MTDDIFAPIIESTATNQRKVIRYYSSSNQATVTFKPFFRRSKIIDILIINISSKGTRFSTKFKFSLKSKIILHLNIEGGSDWLVAAKLVRLYKNAEFGVAFDSVQHDLVDELMLHEKDFSIAEQ